VKKGMIMTNDRALDIVQQMASDRNTGVLEVLKEYDKYSVDGEAPHFWPDENTACRVAMEGFRKLFAG
jgi:hypothetical protein